MAASTSDPVVDSCPAIVGQDCLRSASVYSPHRLGDYTSTCTRYPCTPEYSWPFNGFSRPPFDDPIVPYSGCPSLTRTDYMVTDYGYMPTPSGAVYGCVASGVGAQSSNASILGGVALNYCCPTQHAALPTASDEVFHSAHSSAHVSHGYTQPYVPAYSPTHTDGATLQAAPDFGSQDRNGYRNPIYVSSGSNGFTKFGVSDVLAHTDHTHSPLHTEPRVSYDIPKFKLTQERALPLVRWYEEHQDHPYPSRQEKLNLCQATQLTYTQVSTWFANARRRSKKREMCLGCTSSDEGET